MQALCFAGRLIVRRSQVAAGRSISFAIWVTAISASFIPAVCASTSGKLAESFEFRS